MDNLEEEQYKREELMKKYPLLFPNGYPVCGFDCGIGWFSLLDELFAAITNIVNKSDLPGAEKFVVFAQIKEKYGGLRVYTDSVHESIYKEVQNVIEQAESRSFEICEDCGKPGRTRSDGWIKVRCDDCEKLNTEHMANRFKKVFYNEVL